MPDHSVSQKSTSNSGWWRTVLGEYPTGVTLVTTLDADGGPAGMVVGTFSAVSQNPPLVSFTPMNSSQTFGELTRHGRFVASVLGSTHEDLCRAFAERSEDRFSRADWTEGASGIPRLTDAIAWFEGTVINTVPAGDHTIVVGAVEDFGVGDGSAGMPLLFLKGGYGSFQIRSLRFDYRELGQRQRVADSMSTSLKAFARRERVGCAIATVSGDSVVMLSIANYASDHDAQVYASFPFAAPVAPVLAAWAASPEVLTTWTEGARHLLGRIDRPRLNAALSSVRERGYAVSLGDTVATRFGLLTGERPPTLAETSALWSDMDADQATLEEDPDWYREVSAIQLPVLDSQGAASLELVVTIERGLSRERFDELVRAAQALASELSVSIQ